jgi:hypothetical protein
MDIFDSYSSRSGEIFLAEILLQVWETNKQSKDLYTVYIHESAGISEGTVDVF